MSCMSQNYQDNERLALENEELAVAYNNALKEIAILKKYREKAKENEYNKQALINQERSADREIERLRKRVQELEEENKHCRELLLKIFKVTQNHQIEKISDYAFIRAGMLFYEWLGASGAIDLDRYCDEVNGHDDYDDYIIERMIDEMIKARIKSGESE